MKIDNSPNLPFLSHPELKKDWNEKGSELTLPPGKVILKPGSYISEIPFVLEGAVKVIRRDDEGHEIYLYHILTGQSCAMTLTSFFAGEKSAVTAQTVKESRILVIPADDFRDWVNTYPQLYRFVQHTYHQRFNELLEALDSVAFHKVDSQLVRLLQDRSQAIGSSSVSITHQAIADELNTSREVISRLLKKLEHTGAVKLGRSTITILDLPQQA